MYSIMRRFASSTSRTRSRPSRFSTGALLYGATLLSAGTVFVVVIDPGWQYRKAVVISRSAASILFCRTTV